MDFAEILSRLHGAIGREPLEDIERQLCPGGSRG